MISIELRTASMEWVFIEIVRDATSEEVASYLKHLKTTYPDNLIRAVNTATGKIIDLI